MAVFRQFFGEFVRKFSPLLAATAFFCLFSSGSFAAGPLVLEKAYITEDSTWSGVVVLKGQNVVKRGVKLTILPGTTVKFPYMDEDKNGIGDGELTVDGTLVAAGTKENPIVFTSAEEKPTMKDWTFVQISVSRDSIVENAVFEYSFTGLQVHYSKAEVRDCLFHYNYEGMRFSTADVLIENNDFIENIYGVRTEANGSRTTVRKNIFRGNEHAFFPVRKTGDTVKFYDNDFSGQLQYNVKVGQSQQEDLNLAGNWWGTADRVKIEALFYDKGKDQTLGRVLYEPFLTAPAEGAGRR